MEGAPASTALAAAAAAPSASPSRGAPRGRGGRGRGGRGDSRGRGRGGGDRGRGAFRGRGRGDGRGGDRGGRGRGGRGGRGFVPKKTMRHRSLSGKHGSHTDADGAPPAKRERKDQKPNSNFALLHSMLGDAAMIAEYIRDYHSSEKFRDPKSVNSFLQAISQRPEKVYTELIANHKDEVFTTLERLFAVYALGKQTMLPAAHEFLIRCEQEGVRKSAWGEGVKTLPEKAPEPEEGAEAGEDGAEGEGVARAPPKVTAPPLPAEATSLLSPRELLKKLAALDPVGRLQRLIELSSTVEDVQVCAKKLTALLSDSEGSASGNSGSAGGGGGAAGEKFDFAAKCQLISKLLSKARRVVEPAFASPPKAAAKDGEEEKEEQKEEADGEGNADSVDVHGKNEEEEKEGEAVQEAQPTAAQADAESPNGAVAPPAPVRRRGPLTPDEVDTFQATISVVYSALEQVLAHRAPNVTQQPLSKFTKLLEWCKAHGLLASEDERFLAVLEQQAESDLTEQATQLETVINLKSITAGDTAALDAVVEQLWEAGESKCLVPSSVDVLSAIAVAASAAGIEAESKRRIADRLVQTQRHLPDSVVLPRRALRFVNDERNKVKQAAIAKQLEDEAANYNAEHAEDGEEADADEVDMALEEA